MQKYTQTTWRLWKLLKPFHKDFYIQLFFIIFMQAVGVGLIFLTSKLLDSIVNKNFQIAFTILAVFFIVKIIEHTVAYFSERHAFSTIQTRIQQHLQEFSFAKIFTLNPNQFQEDHSAIKLQVINRGEQAADNIISDIVLEILPVVTQVVFSLIMIFFYSVSIFFICLFTLVFVSVWSYRFSNYHRPFIKQNMDNWDKFQKIRSEAFQHLYLIKIFSSINKFTKKYLQDRKVNLNYHFLTWLKRINHAYKRKLFFAVSRNASTLILVYISYLGQITIGGIYAVWQYLGNVYDQIFVIIRSMTHLPLRFVELEKYLEIIDKEPDFVEESDIKFVDGDIVFENLSFKYPKGKDNNSSNVLEDINITIPHGKKVAFVGASGSGKTTITRLLLRAYNYNNIQDKNENKSAGSIKINGVELKEIDAQSLRRGIGYVEQHVDLFDDTIKNNILFGVDEKVLHSWEKEKIVDHKLEEVAKLARIDEFYHRLGEQKFETHIGERGIKLSGGERQRIGIARAIIKNPSVLIFDEATSALDTVNEKYIKEAIDNVSKGRTTIIIAHRLSTVVDSDIIFVMNLGKVVASGTHTDLLESSEYYQELIKHQELK